MMTLLLIIALDLSLKSEAVIKKQDIYLSDLLSKNSLIELKEEGIGNLKVTRSPSYDQARTVFRSHVDNAIRNAHPKTEVKWQGPDRIRVTRKGASFSKESLEDSIRDWVTSKSPQTGELHVDDIYMPSLRGLPAGTTQFELRDRGRNQLVGRRSIYVDFLKDNRKVKTIAVQVSVSLETQVARLLVDVPRGTPISEDQIEWDVQRIDRMLSPLITPDNFKDLRAKTVLRAGDVLDMRKVQTIPLVERNGMVMVVVNYGGLRVHMKAMALDQGAAGQIIRLKNTDTNKMFTGTVQADGSVALEM